jgi:GTP-binding protein EngB required for normal cell division
MEMDLKIMQLEREIIETLNRNGLPLSVVDLMLDKIKNQVGKQITEMLVKHQQEQNSSEQVMEAEVVEA